MKFNWDNYIEKRWEVYKIIDIRTNEILYIGYSKEIKIRSKVHFNSNTKSIISEYMNNFREKESIFKIEILFKFLSKQEAHEKEKELIRLYKPRFNIIQYSKENSYEKKTWKQSNLKHNFLEFRGVICQKDINILFSN